MLVSIISVIFQVIELMQNLSRKIKTKLFTNKWPQINKTVRVALQLCIFIFGAKLKTLLLDRTGTLNVLLRDGQSLLWRDRFPVCSAFRHCYYSCFNRKPKLFDL